MTFPRIFPAAMILITMVAGAQLQAGIIPLNSDLSPTESNNQTGANQFIDVHPYWQPNGPDYSWISYLSTTGGWIPVFSPPNVGGSDLTSATPTAVFQELFVVNTELVGGSVTFWADDTATIWLDRPNGGSVKLHAANPVQDGACAAGPLGCEPAEFVTLSLAGLDAGPGTYGLRMEVFQRASGPFGIMYTGFALDRDLDDPESVPEPSTYLTVSLGLLAAGLVRRRKAN